LREQTPFFCLLFQINVCFSVKMRVFLCKFTKRGRLFWWLFREKGLYFWKAQVYNEISRKNAAVRIFCKDGKERILQHEKTNRMFALGERLALAWHDGFCRSRITNAHDRGRRR
jgi:hypothetical protein